MGNHSVSESAAESVPAKEQGFGIYRALASVGPSFVYILTALGAGDIVSNATAGASYGYQLIWALGLTLIFRFIWVNISSKYVLVTGESLLAGYGRLGSLGSPVVPGHPGPYPSPGQPVCHPDHRNLSRSALSSPHPMERGHLGRVFYFCGLLPDLLGRLFGGGIFL